MHIVPSSRKYDWPSGSLSPNLRRRRRRRDARKESQHERNMGTNLRLAGVYDKRESVCV